MNLLSNSNNGKPSTLFKNIPAKIAAIPIVLIAYGIFVGGTLWTIFYSFTASRLLPSTDKMVGFKQYVKLWDSRTWLISVENMLIYGILSLIAVTVVGFVLAAIFDQKIRFENTFRTILLYPFALSFIVTGLAWQWLLNPDMGLGLILQNWGITSEPFNPLYDSKYVLYAIVFTNLWQGMGFYMCLFLAGLRAIDSNVWSAIKVDGISTINAYLFVIIPMMRPTFFMVFVLKSAVVIKTYDLIVIMTNGGPGISSVVPAYVVFEKMFAAQNLGQAFAGSTMMLIAVMLLMAPFLYGKYRGNKS